MEALRRSFEWGASLCALRKYPYVQLEPAHFAMRAVSAKRLVSGLLGGRPKRWPLKKRLWRGTFARFGFVDREPRGSRVVNLHAGDPLIQVFHGLFGMGSGDETCSEAVATLDVTSTTFWRMQGSSASPSSSSPCVGLPRRCTSSSSARWHPKRAMKASRHCREARRDLVMNAKCCECCPADDRRDIS